MKAVTSWTLLTKLLGGAVLMLLFIALPQIALERYFWNLTYRSTEFRRMAFNAQIELLKALRFEKEIRFYDLASAEFLEGKETENLRMHREAMRRLTESIEQIQKSAGQEKVDIESVTSLAQSYDDAFQRFIANVRTAGSNLEREQLLEKMQQVSSGIEPIIQRAVNLGVDESRRAHNQYEYWSVVVTAGSLALGCLIFYFLSRSITRPLVRLKHAVSEVGSGNFKVQMRTGTGDEVGILADTFSDMTANLLDLLQGVKRSGIHVTSSATQIAAAAKQLEATVSEQAASTHQVVSTAKQISDTSNELTGTMKQLHVVAEDTRLLVEAGQTGLVNMQETMNELQSGIRLITSRLSILREKADRITSVIRTMSKVAEQTNLLSINAAIEAEKAGEAGPGFAVVASEIRRVADQTSISAKEIETMIFEMLEAVGAGVSSVAQFSGKVQQGVHHIQTVGDQLVDIIHHVKILAPRFETVTNAMSDQSGGAEQISESMSDLLQAAQQTAQSVRELNETADRLNQASRSLQSEVGRFRIVSE